MRKEKRLRSIIMDFDLTLVDSTRPAEGCVSHALDSLGYPPASSAAVRETIGLTLEKTFEVLTGLCDSSLEQRFHELFVQKADTVMVEQTDFFEGVPEMLAELRDRDLELAIVSTKYRYRIEAILERLKARDLFKVIVGGEDVRLRKPSPEGIGCALRQLNGSKDESLYVGDHIVDAEAATRALVPFLGVVTGATSREAFLSHRHAGVLDSIVSLPSFLDCVERWPPNDAMPVG